MCVCVLCICTCQFMYICILYIECVNVYMCVCCVYYKRLLWLCVVFVCECVLQESLCVSVCVCVRLCVCNYWHFFMLTYSYTGTNIHIYIHINNIAITKLVQDDIAMGDNASRYVTVNMWRTLLHILSEDGREWGKTSVEESSVYTLTVALNKHVLLTFLRTSPRCCLTARVQSSRDILTFFRCRWYHLLFCLCVCCCST